MNSFLTDEEEAALVAEIREQEQRTSAEIRVCISEKFILFPERYAWRTFEKIGMRKTRQRNGALIVVVPSRKKIVICADTGFDAVVPTGFWKDSVNAMIQQMHNLGQLDALLEGLHRLGDTLAIHWPAKPGDHNELPDEILR